MTRTIVTIGILYFIFHVQPDIGANVFRFGAAVVAAIISGISNGIAQA